MNYSRNLRRTAIVKRFLITIVIVAMVFFIIGIIAGYILAGVTG